MLCGSTVSPSMRTRLRHEGRLLRCFLQTTFTFSLVAHGIRPQAYAFYARVPESAMTQKRRPPLKVFGNEGQQTDGEGDGRALNRQALYPLRMVA